MLLVSWMENNRFSVMLLAHSIIAVVVQLCVDPKTSITILLTLRYNVSPAPRVYTSLFLYLFYLHAGIVVALKQNQRAHGVSAHRLPSET